MRTRGRGPGSGPPNWSAQDWSEELRAEGAAAAWQARGAFDPARGVPWDAFVRLRVLSAARTRSRQEWAYAVHCGTAVAADGGEDRPDEASAAAWAHEALRGALARLAGPDRWLIERLYWDGWTEAAVAAELGLSQSAVSRRKRALLRALRRWIGARDATEEF